MNEFNKTFTTSEDIGITLTNNEIKDIITGNVGILLGIVLGNVGILLKGTTGKINSQKKVYSIFLRH